MRQLKGYAGKTVYPAPDLWDLKRVHALPVQRMNQRLRFLQPVPGTLSQTDQTLALPPHLQGLWSYPMLAASTLSPRSSRLIPHWNLLIILNIGWVLENLSGTVA